MTDAAAIAARYDEWAQTYEHELVDEWRYEAPVVAARLLANTGIVRPVRSAVSRKPTDDWSSPTASISGNRKTLDGHSENFRKRVSFVT